MRKMCHSCTVPGWAWPRQAKGTRDQYMLHRVGILSQIGSASVMKIFVTTNLQLLKLQKSGRTDLFNKTWGFFKTRLDLVVAM